MADVTCPQCGHRNPLGSNFCSSCGAALGERTSNHTTMSVTVAHRRAPSTRWRSSSTTSRPAWACWWSRGARTPGSRFALDEPLVTAGRHPDSDIFLDDITVSRRHAEVRKVEGGYEVADVGSLNGTYLNRERVESARAHRRRRAPDRHVQAALPRGPVVTTAMADRSHLSIGEVLSLLQDDFPDVTISKIRFLESQGLLDPERTPVGLPEVLRGRHRAAALDPPPAARPLPAAQGDQGPAGGGHGRPAWWCPPTSHPDRRRARAVRGRRTARGQHPCRPGGRAGRGPGPAHCGGASSHPVGACAQPTSPSGAHHARRCRSARRSTRSTPGPPA